MGMKQGNIKNAIHIVLYAFKISSHEKEHWHNCPEQNHKANAEIRNLLFDVPLRQSRHKSQIIVSPFFTLIKLAALAPPLDIRQQTCTDNW